MIYPSGPTCLLGKKKKVKPLINLEFQWDQVELSCCNLKQHVCTNSTTSLFWCQHSLMVSKPWIQQSCWENQLLYRKIIRKDEIRAIVTRKKRQFMNRTECLHSSPSLFFLFCQSLSDWQGWLQPYSALFAVLITPSLPPSLPLCSSTSAALLPHVSHACVRQAGNRPSHYTPGFAKPSMTDRQFKQPCHCSSPFDFMVFKVNRHVVWPHGHFNCSF